MASDTKTTNEVRTESGKPLGLKTTFVWVYVKIGTSLPRLFTRNSVRRKKRKKKNLLG